MNTENNNQVKLTSEIPELPITTKTQKTDGTWDHNSKTYKLSKHEELLTIHAKKAIQLLQKKPEALFQFPHQLPPKNSSSVADKFLETHAWLLKKTTAKRRRIIAHASKFFQAYLQHQARTLICSILNKDAPPFETVMPPDLPQNAAQYFFLCIKPDFKKVFMILETSGLTDEEKYIIKTENNRLRTEKDQFQKKLLEEKEAQTKTVATLTKPDGTTLHISKLQMDKMQELGMVPPPGYLQPEDPGYTPPSKILNPNGKPAYHTDNLIKPTNL